MPPRRVAAYRRSGASLRLTPRELLRSLRAGFMRALARLLDHRAVPLHPLVRTFFAERGPRNPLLHTLAVRTIALAAFGVGPPQTFGPRPCAAKEEHHDGAVPRPSHSQLTGHPFFPSRFARTLTQDT